MSVAGMAVREQTDGERIIQVVEEVKQLRKEVALLRVMQAQSDRYLDLLQRFLGLAEGRHLQSRQMMGEEEPFPQSADRILNRVEEFAKALDVENALKARDDGGEAELKP